MPGTFEAVEISSDGVRVTLSSGTAQTPEALLRVTRPGKAEEVGGFMPRGEFRVEREGIVIPLEAGFTEVTLGRGGV